VRFAGAGAGCGSRVRVRVRFTCGQNFTRTPGSAITTFFFLRHCATVQGKIPVQEIFSLKLKVSSTGGYRGKGKDMFT